MRYPLPPVTEGTSGQVVTMQAIPSRRIAALAVGGESVQLPVSMNDIRGRQSSPGHGIGWQLGLHLIRDFTIGAVFGLGGGWLLLQ